MKPAPSAALFSCLLNTGSRSLSFIFFSSTIFPRSIIVRVFCTPDSRASFLSAHRSSFSFFRHLQHFDSLSPFRNATSSVSSPPFFPSISLISACRVPFFRRSSPPSPSQPASGSATHPFPLSLLFRGEPIFLPSAVSGFGDASGFEIPLSVRPRVLSPGF